VEDREPGQEAKVMISVVQVSIHYRCSEVKVDRDYAKSASHATSRFSVASVLKIDQVGAVVSI
jgi:hypothetical protein